MSRARNLILLLTCMVAAPVVHAKRTTAPIATSTRSEFIASDSLRLSYTRFGEFANASKGPIVISPGRGESAYRYEELASELIAQGFGPVYMLDHRSQGHSAATGARAELVHVHDFEEYVTDFTDFVRGPVAKDLHAHGVSDAPFVVAHSMGGAIANLALLKDPTLARKTVYFAPMMDLNIAWMNAGRDRPAFWLTKLLCLAGYCDDVALGAMQKPGAKPSPTLAKELADGIFRSAVTPGWVKESIKATWRIAKNAGRHREESLIILATRDKIVQNEATRAYACTATNCTLQEIDGPHSLHQVSRSQSKLVEAIAGYFKTCDAELAPVAP